MGSLSEFGKLGLTSIGNTPTEAETIYRRVEEVLDAETESLINTDPDNLSPSLPITWLDSV